MSEKSKHNKYDVDRFLDYIHNRMSQDDRNAFEKQLLKDPFAEEALEGLAMLDEDSVNHEIYKLNKRIKGNDRSTRIKWIRGIAAAIGLLFLSVITFWAIEQTRKSMDSSRMAHEPTTIETHVADSLSEEIPVDPLPEVETAVSLPEPTLPVLAESKKVEEQIITPEPEVWLHDMQEIAVAEEDYVMELESIFVKGTESRIAQTPMMVLPRVELPAPEDGFKSIAGKIIDATDGTPLPGVAIIIKGTSQGTITDINGNFELEIPEGKDVKLTASFLGMITEEFSSETFDNTTLAMVPDQAILNEVIVVGYGSQRRATLESPTADYRNRYDYSPPLPVNGYPEFRRYIAQNTTLPDTTALRRAVVVLNFDIDVNGQPTNFTALRSPGEEYTRLAIDLIRSGPEWNPARLGDRNIEDSVRVRIVFRK